MLIQKYNFFVATKDGKVPKKYDIIFFYEIYDPEDENNIKEASFFPIGILTTEDSSREFWVLMGGIFEEGIIFFDNELGYFFSEYVGEEKDMIVLDRDEPLFEELEEKTKEYFLKYLFDK